VPSSASPSPRAGRNRTGRRGVAGRRRWAVGGEPALSAALAGALPAARAAQDPGRARLPVRVLAPGVPSREQLADVAELVVVGPECGATDLLRAGVAAGVPHVTVVTSTQVYCALPDNPALLAEDAPLRAPSGPAVRGLLDLEAAAAEQARHGASIAVLRPGVLLGAGAVGPLSGIAESPRLLLPRGSSAVWQLTHTSDLATAVLAAADNALEGAAAVVGSTTIGPADLERVLGIRLLEVPEAVVRATAERLSRLGVTRTPVDALEWLLYPCLVDGARLRALGWAPLVADAAALRAHATLHGLDTGTHGRAVAVAGTGAGTMAVVGTAALVRRARRRRGR
jgi:hypothetical protein